MGISMTLLQVSVVAFVGTGTVLMTFLFLNHHAISAGAIPGHLEEKIRNIWSRYPTETAATALRIYKPSEDYDNVFSAKSERGLETGYRRFDELSTGLQKGEVCTVAARTGVGKTNWGIGAAYQVCSTGRRVLYFSTEMDVKSIWSRAQVLGPNKMDGLDFLVCDEFTPDLKRIEIALAEVKPDLFIFDHINNVGEDYESLSRFMRGLNELARKFSIPGLVMAQLNRSADFLDQKGNKITPRLSMIKGSGVIEEVSAQVLLLQEMRNTEGQIDIIGVLDKNRYGERGIVNFALKKAPYRMIEA